MVTFSLNFVKRNGKLCLGAVVRETRKRHYKVVEGLKNPNLASWNQKRQMFDKRSANAEFNNDVVKKTLADFERLVENHAPQSGPELFRLYDNLVGARKAAAIRERQEKKQKEITLGEWLDVIIDSIKNPQHLKPTSAYQGYLMVKHRLEGEGTLLKTPVSQLNDDSFLLAIKWINSQNGKHGKGNNYIGFMKMFRAAISRAKKARLTTYTPDFPYMDHAPITHKIPEKASLLLKMGGTVNSLTREQMEEFRNIDLSGIPLARGTHMEYYKELYRDFALLLYELKSRPADIMKLHWDNIALDKHTGRYTLAYIPAKKKNYGKSARHTMSALVVQYLSDEALGIMNKYKGKSVAGYVFPFPINQRKWNLDKPEEYHHYYYKSNHVHGAINKFLRRVGKAIGVPFDLTLYAFRRSAITHAIMDNKLPVAVIAKMAGTSIPMIEMHYANYLHTMAAY